MDNRMHASVLGQLEDDGGLTDHGVWSSDDDTVSWLYREELITSDHKPTPELVALIPGLTLVVCNGPGVSYG